MSKKDEDIFLGDPIRVSVSKCVGAPWNYKQPATDEEMDRFAASCKKGMTPLHAARRKESKDQTVYEICDGNHRLDMLKQFGYRTVLVWDHGLLTLKQRKEIGLRYNEWTFITDPSKRAQLVLDIVDDIPDFKESMPYSDDELDLLSAMLRSDATIDETPVDTQYMGRGKYNKVKTITCPSCGEEFNVGG